MERTPRKSPCGCGSERTPASGGSTTVWCQSQRLGRRLEVALSSSFRRRSPSSEAGTPQKPEHRTPRIAPAMAPVIGGGGSELSTESRRTTVKRKAERVFAIFAKSEGERWPYIYDLTATTGPESGRYLKYRPPIHRPPKGSDGRLAPLANSPGLWTRTSPPRPRTRAQNLLRTRSRPRPPCWCTQGGAVVGAVVTSTVSCRRNVDRDRELL